MALRFNAKAPNGARTSVASPVMVIIFDKGMSYPAALMAATPGKFCDAMVTINNGSARLTMALQVNMGVTNTGFASSKMTLAGKNKSFVATYIIAIKSVTGTAYRGEKRFTNRWLSNINTTSGNAVCAAIKACKPNLASTPASKADAMAIGMRFITRSNQPVTPNKVINMAQAMKAPTASFIEKPPVKPAVAKTAAPGVLQATMTGLRSQSEGMALHKPIPRPKAHIHEVNCSGVALNANAA